jgi:serine-type D-Ala-D-Ala endopeptidase (penicillin-binding protein 7)
MLRARLWGALLLTALVACPTTTVEAATRSQSRHAATHPHARGTPGRPAAKLRPVSRQRHVHRGHVAHRLRGRRGPIGVVYARNAIVIDPTTDEVLYEKDSSASVPIASLTKLMSALVFLEQKPDFDREVEVTRAELAGAGHTRLRNGERVSIGNLMHMSLMCSDNAATRVLARESGLPPDTFVARMNAKARELGMRSTHYVEPTGLDERNLSTAADIARVLHAAGEQPTIRRITTTPTYVFTSELRRRSVLHEVHNTNRLLASSRYEIACGKTGFINEAGYCFATWLRDRGRDLIAVVLGAPTGATRFADVVRLVQHAEASGGVAQHD